MDAAETSPLPQDLVFVDLETTGGNAAHHRITEVGIVRVENGALVEEWSSLVNPQCEIPASIEAFTGISNAMVADAPRFCDIAALVADKLKNAVFVAHNARFDYAFLRSEFRRADRRFSAKVLCTVKLSRRLYPGPLRHNLDAVIERHRLTCKARHRALGDARVLWDFWCKLGGQSGDPVLAGAVRALLAVTPLPAHLPPELAEELPDGPGVYRFFGEDDALLYVGRSQSLRTRVLAHFAAGPGDSKEQKLAALVRRVDWSETAGELGARLREAAWARGQHPLHNRRPRGGRDTVTLWAEPADPGQATPGRVKIMPIDAIDQAARARCFGLFRSLKEADRALRHIAHARGLCLLTLGLEEGSGSCVAYQFGRCRGACVGKDPAALHALRVQLALSSLKLKPWPFPGRVALRESDWRGQVDLHVCDNWEYIGTARSADELAALCENRTERPFDVEVYHTLARHLEGQRRLDWIDLSPAASGR